MTPDPLSAHLELVDRVAFELEGGPAGRRAAWKLKGDSHAAARAVLRVVEADRDRYRALLEEFDSHRVDSDIAWFDEWSRRVQEVLSR